MQILSRLPLFELTIEIVRSYWASCVVYIRSHQQLYVYRHTDSKEFSSYFVRNYINVTRELCWNLKYFFFAFFIILSLLFVFCFSFSQPMWTISKSHYGGLSSFAAARWIFFLNSSKKWRQMKFSSFFTFKNSW